MSDPLISVIIPCYDRMDPLTRTLRACFAQAPETGQLPPFEILVADNHFSKMGRQLVHQLARESPVPLRHIDAGVRNIAQARNFGVQASQAKLIAFIDDDEAPEKFWLARLGACLARTGADAVFGPKLPEWQTGRPPAWDPEGLYYTTDFGLAPDSDIDVLRWVPPRGRGLGTGNSMLWRSSCMPNRYPFDEEVGRTGGEDTDLFFRLARAGKRFVWCPDAVVREWVEAERMEATYMRARLYRSGQHSVQSRIAVSASPGRTLLTGWAIGAGQVALHGAMALASGELFRRDRMQHRFGLAKGLGKLAWAAHKSFLLGNP